MERVSIEDVPRSPDAATVMRPLTEALDATNLAINYYELAPGDSTAYGYHAHESQEEVFLVREGTVTFETEEGTVDVGPGEVIRFGPGEYQQATNEDSERVVAIVLGAPQDTGGSDVVRYCETCEERTATSIEGDEQDGEPIKLTRCIECDTVTGRFSR